jgi:hypothetical protein
MRITRRVAGACLTLCLSASGAVGQSTGVAISGPSPWIAVTAPPYSAACNGTTDDTVAIQKGLNAVPGSPPTGGTLYIPPTALGCEILGSEFAVNTIFSTASSGYATVTVTSSSNSPPLNGNFPTEANLSNANVPLINIHNVPNGSNGTIFNGTYVVALVGRLNGSNVCVSSGGMGHFCFNYMVKGANETSTSPPGAAAEIGLYYNGNNLRVAGGAAG